MEQGDVLLWKFQFCHQNLPATFFLPRRNDNRFCNHTFWGTVQINTKTLEKDSFWVQAKEEELESDVLFAGLMEQFSSKVVGKDLLLSVRVAICQTAVAWLVGP